MRAVHFQRKIFNFLVRYPSISCAYPDPRVKLQEIEDRIQKCTAFRKHWLYNAQHDYTESPCEIRTNWNRPQTGKCIASIWHFIRISRVFTQSTVHSHCLNIFGNFWKYAVVETALVEFALSETNPFQTNSLPQHDISSALVEFAMNKHLINLQ